MSISFFCNIDIIDIVILPPKCTEHSALLPNCQRKKPKSLKTVGLQILRVKKRIQNEKQKKILKRCRSAVLKEKNP